MPEPTKDVSTDPGGERPRASGLLSGLLIGAIVLLIAIAVVSFR